MKFLDLNGLKHLLTKIKASFGTAIVISSKSEQGNDEYVIPFVTNHQIVNLDTRGVADVSDWFQKASKGGILEIVVVGQGGSVLCNNNSGESCIYKMKSTNPDKIESLPISGRNYARLIKTDNYTLFVAEYVTNA